MSMNSRHQLAANSQGFFATSISHKMVVDMMRSEAFILQRNYMNAGNTAFDEYTIQIGYMRARGVSAHAAEMVGYRLPRGGGKEALKGRVLRMGPWKVRAMHETMKQEGLIPVHEGSPQGGGKHAVFYTFERLLQLFFTDYEALKIPQRIRNWVPEEGSYWHHWWKAR